LTLSVRRVLSLLPDCRSNDANPESNLRSEIETVGVAATAD